MTYSGVDKIVVFTIEGDYVTSFGIMMCVPIKMGLFMLVTFCNKIDIY